MRVGAFLGRFLFSCSHIRGVQVRTRTPQHCCSFHISKPSSSSHVVPVFSRAPYFRERTAVVDQHGKHTYKDLYIRSQALSKMIIQLLGHLSRNNSPERVSFLCPNNSSYVVCQWAVWMSEESNTNVLRPLAEQLGISMLSMSGSQSLCPSEQLQEIEVSQLELEWKDRGAMIIYTSGTTGRPKGVLSTHYNLYSMVASLVSEWGWTKEDIILHVLPLHHVHGVVNKLKCPLWVGATCVMLPEFCPQTIWQHFLNRDAPSINIFMAVPTIYSKLIAYYEQHFTHSNVREFVRAACKEKIRKEGTFYTINAQGDSTGTMVLVGLENREGELQVRGPAVFKNIGTNRMRRRNLSPQMAGLKQVSALEVERHLLGHPSINDVAVIGAPDVTWDQRVAAIVKLRDGHSLSFQELKEWARAVMAPYCIPAELIRVEEIPRNQMGKINKKQLLVHFYAQ
ncbi:hypothetical protein XELAEV_18003580mg [Xenopus laevis]|nr:hypothetical protein XELAEV_18003580mg [Xenopus laevis]